MTTAPTNTDLKTWHYGLIARWWGEFNHDGDDIDYFQRKIGSSGQPALDLGCGAGRLLTRFRQNGLDVDGCDISEDMIARCRERLDREGLNAELYTQPMSELDLPRRYRTVVISGSFAIGGHRRDDHEALRRIHRHLEPGGLLAFDLYVPNVDERSWRTWLPANRPKLPSRWPERGDRKRCADGSELELKARVLDFDPLNQILIREMRAEHWRDGELIASEEGSLSINIYFKSEVVLMLETAGFVDVQVKAGLTEVEARPWNDVHLMFLARRSDGDV
jgi:SAM-dependent methyltransferase